MTSNPLSDDIRRRLSKLLPLLASDKAGEVVATASAIVRTMTSAGQDIHDLTSRLLCDSETSGADQSDELRFALRNADLWHKAYIHARTDADKRQAVQSELRSRVLELEKAVAKWRTRATKAEDRRAKRETRAELEQRMAENKLKARISALERDLAAERERSATLNSECNRHCRELAELGVGVVRDVGERLQ